MTQWTKAGGSSFSDFLLVFSFNAQWKFAGHIRAPPAVRRETMSGQAVAGRHLAARGQHARFPVAWAHARRQTCGVLQPAAAPGIGTRSGTDPSRSVGKNVRLMAVPLQFSNAQQLWAPLDLVGAHWNTNTARCACNSCAHEFPN